MSNLSKQVKSNIDNLSNERDSACKLNSLIGTMHILDSIYSVSAVITYLTEVQTLDGIVPSEKADYGRTLILQMCDDALMFEYNAYETSSKAQVKLQGVNHA